MKREGAISLVSLFCGRVTEEALDVGEEALAGDLLRQDDPYRRFERQGAQAEDGFCVEPGSLIVKMDRKRLTVGDRGELGQFVHGVKLNGIFSHGKSSCNGLYNRGGIRYNKAAKRQWTTDRSFKKTEAGTSISSAII